MESGRGGGAEKGGIAEGSEAGEAQDLSAFEVAEVLAAGGVEVAMEELEPVDLAIGAAGGADGVPLGVGRGSDDACAEDVAGGRGVGGEDEEGVGEVPQVAVQDGIDDLEGLRELPGADIVARAVEGAGEGMGTGREKVQAQIFDGVGAQAAHIVAGIVPEGFAEDQASVGGEGARGAGKEGAPGFGGKFVEDVVEEDDVEFFGGGGEFAERGGGRAEGGVGPAGAAEGGEEIVEAAEGGAGVVPGGEGDGAGAEVVDSALGTGEQVAAGEHVVGARRPPLPVGGSDR